MAENPHLRRLRYVLLSLAVALMATELAVCIFFPALWRRYLDVLGTRFGGPLASLMLMLVLALLVVALLWSNRKSSRLDRGLPDRQHSAPHGRSTHLRPVGNPAAQRTGPGAGAAL